MEGIIAKRSLRSSSMNTRYNRGFNKKDSINSVYRKSLAVRRKINSEDTANKSFIQKVIFNIKMKLWIQAINSMCMLILIVSCSMLNIKLINNNKYVRIVKNEYKKDYPQSSIKKEIKSLLKYGYNGVLKVVPDRVENNLKNMYKDVKEKLKEAKKSSNIAVYTDSNKDDKKEEKTEKRIQENNSIYANAEESEEKIQYQEAVSAISSQDPYIKYINDNNIKFVMPTKGTISSRFGEREVIFSDIDSYHTGIDIANKKGTDIVASTDGKVTKVSSNKYNGNFVEITNQKIVTKYIHMDSISIKQEAIVKAGDKIGKMGESGYATGPHLHFEVVIDGTKIDPAKVLNI